MISWFSAKAFSRLTTNSKPRCRIAITSCLENSQSPHYWTEKLTDAYLGWAFPLYVGCPNVGDYFAKESFLLARHG
jgi:hypothetical protein